jgi:hypothetical protein
MADIRGEEIGPPVMAGRFHRHQTILLAAHQLQQLLVTGLSCARYWLRRKCTNAKLNSV